MPTRTKTKANPLKTVGTILKKALDEKRSALSEIEVYEIFDLMGLATPMRSMLTAEGVDSSEAHNLMESFPGSRVVVKVLSSTTLHKTEAGGVKVCPKEKIIATIKNMRQTIPDAEAFMVCEFVEHAVFALGQELMLGARQDRAFGPVISLGIGGTDAEGLTLKLRPGNSPSILPVETIESENGLKEFLNGAWIWRYVSGNVRGGKKLAQDEEMLKWLDAFAKLAREFSDEKGGPVIEEIEVNPLAVSCGRLVALDGVLRVRQACAKKRIPPTPRGVNSLLNPQTVAVAGVSEKNMNMGRIILNNVMKAGFPKEKIYILKDFKGEIDGVSCYASAADFPHPVDMFVITVPSRAVPEVLKDAAHSGKVRGIVLISAGMGETEGSGSMKDEVLKIIADGKKKNPDFSLSGGNSLGLVSNPSKVNTLFIPDAKLPPPIGDSAPLSKTALLSQSGAFIVAVNSRMPDLKPLYSVSVGNQMDVTVVDYVESVAGDKDVKAIFIYIEGFKEGDGLRLLRAVEHAKANGKEVLVYKAGRTPTGQKAVMGHTASIAGDSVVMRSVLVKAGAYVAETLEEFDDMVTVMSSFAGAKPSHGNLFVLTNAGFESAAMADNILPRGPVTAFNPDAALAGKIQSSLKKGNLDAIVDVHNPMDVTPMASDAVILEIAEAALASQNTEAMVVSMVPATPAMRTLSNEDLDNSVAAKLAGIVRKYNKPVVFCVAGGKIYDAYREKAAQSGLPVFLSADRALRALSAFIALRRI
jgi:acyl-CoA synthetase (NDP forming)